jgi:hypothetical protein
LPLAILAIVCAVVVGGLLLTVAITVVALGDPLGSPSAGAWRLRRHWAL